MSPITKSAPIAKTKAAWASKPGAMRLGQQHGTTIVAVRVEVETGEKSATPTLHDAIRHYTASSAVVTGSPSKPEQHVCHTVALALHRRISTVRVGGEQPAKQSINRFGSLQFVLPNPNYQVSQLLQVPPDLSSAGLVRGHFLFPVFPVCPRQWPIAGGASMPKTAVHEDHKAEFLKNEVGATRQPPGVQSPSSNASSNQGQPESPFRRPISGRANSAHPLASLCSAQDVHSADRIASIEVV